MDVIQTAKRCISYLGYPKLLLAIALTLLICIQGYILLGNEASSGDVLTSSDSARKIIEKCTDAKHKPTCYEEEVPKLLKGASLKETFAVIREIQGSDSSYRFCHVLAHKLGEREVAKDPQNWFDVIPRCPTDGLCSNGCVHGAAVERFSDTVFSEENMDKIVSDLSIACEARDEYDPTQLDQAMCYHGLGHLTVHITEAQIETALDMCDQVAKKDDGRNYERVCDEGVFMQLFQPLEPEDFALVDKLSMELTEETVPEFCDRHSRTVEEEGACMRESWPIFSEATKTAEGVVAFCDMSPKSEQDACYESILAIIGRSTLNDPSRSQQICSNLQSPRQSQCFATAGMTIIEEDRQRGKDAVQYCSDIEVKENQDACFERLVSVASFVFNPSDPNLRTMCAAMPDTWRGECMAQIQ